MNTAKAGKHAIALALAVTVSLAVPGAGFAQPADVLRVGDVLGAPSGDPTFTTRSPYTYMLAPIYDMLAQVNADGSFTPQLATEWRNIDATTWRYTLRPNVRFQNGEALTAEGLAGYFTWLLSEAGMATTVGPNTRQASFESVRAVDASTLEIKTRTPVPLLAKLMQSFWIPAPKAWAEGGKEVFARKPVGSGSYRVTDWGPNGVEYEAFAESWRKPIIARLSVQKVPDRTARRSAILSGQLDIAQGMDIDDFEVLERAGHAVDVTVRPQVATLKVIQTRDTPFKDVRVRQAANYAIDRAGIAANIYKGRTKAASQCTVPGSVGYNPDLRPYPYDPAKAKALLAEAGYPNGFDATVQAFLPSPFPGMSDAHQVAAQQMSAVGMRVSLEPITLPDYLKAWLPPAGSDQLGFKGAVFETHCNIVNFDASDGVRDNSCRKKPGFYCDAREQELFDAQELEMDPQKREALLRQLMALGAQNANMIYFVDLIDATGLHKRVRGFKNDNTRYSYHTVSFGN